MLSSTSSTPVLDDRRLLRQKKAADGALQIRPLADISNTPRRAFNDLTNRVKPQKSDLIAARKNVIEKHTQQRPDDLLFQEKSAQICNAESGHKEDDSIEYYFGNSEPAEWKGEMDAMDYLRCLRDPDLVLSEVEEEPASHVPLVDIPRLPDGFFDDMPDALFDDSSENDVKDELLPTIELP